jgi:serine/threonine protein kinase
MHVIAERVSHDPPPPSARNQDVDRRLENICLRMMHRDPDKRFQSMKKVVRAIDKSGLLAPPTLMCHVPPLHPDEAGDDAADSDTSLAWSYLWMRNDSRCLGGWLIRLFDRYGKQNRAAAVDCRQSPVLRRACS